MGWCVSACYDQRRRAHDLLAATKADLALLLQDASLRFCQSGVGGIPLAS